MAALDEVWGNDQLVGEVLPYLDGRALGSAECVCVAWRRLAADLRLWSRLCVASPRCLVGLATRALHDMVGSKRYMHLVEMRRHRHDLRQHDLRSLVESELWLRTLVEDKWLVRVHIAFAMDVVIPRMEEGPDVAHILGSFAEVLDDAFAEYILARDVLMTALSMDDSGWVTHHLALLAEKQQDYDQAEVWFRRGFGADDMYIPNVLNFAVFMEERRMQYDAAEELYRHALQHAVAPGHRLDVYYALGDFYLLKRRDTGRTRDILRQAYESLKDIDDVDGVAGRDVKVAIQYAEFLVYVYHDYATAATIFKVVLHRWKFEQGRQGKLHPDVALLLQTGLLSYAICVVYATSSRELARRLMEHAAAVEQCTLAQQPHYGATSLPRRLVDRYKLTAAVVVQHATDLCRPLTCKLDVDSLAPLMGLLYYLEGDTAGAMALWAAYIRRLSNIHSHEYAFAGYCTGAVLHVAGKPDAAAKAIVRAFTVDAHNLQFQNLDLVLREVAHEDATSRRSTDREERRHRALACRDVLMSYSLAYEAGTLA